MGEILRVARFENVTQIVVGRTRRTRVARLGRRSLAEALAQAADGIAVHVVTSDGGDEPRRGWRDHLPAAAPLRGYLEATLGVVLAVAIGHGLTRVVALPNISMLFLTAVLVPAVRSGVWPAIYASVLSFFAYNFFFIDPLYTFTIARPHEFLALAVFLLIAVVTSTVAGRARDQAHAAIQRVRATRRLYEFTRKLSSLPAADAVAEAAASEIRAIVGRSTVLLRQRGGELAIAAAWPPEDRLDTASMTAARWAFDRGEAAGADTATLPNVPWLFLPLVSGRGPTGVLGVEDAPDGVPLDAEHRTLLDSLVEQTAAALDRAALAGEIEATRMAAETERVRNLLLASISHDFRTPLSSVLGAATSLTDLGDKLAPEERADLLAAIREEAEHLDGMVRNLLSMTRLQAGALEIRRDWTDVREVLERVAAAARRRGAPQAITVTASPGLPLAVADPILLEQAFGNIVGNAVRYAGPNATIALSAEAIGPDLVIAIEDDGPGIEPDLLPHIFEKFVRASARGDGGEGSGLGLAIARGIAEAHGGSLRADSPVADGRGARFTVRLPLTEAAP